jgi:hypothetical protein
VASRIGFGYRGARSRGAAGARAFPLPMTSPSGRLLVGSLLLLAACASTDGAGGERAASGPQTRAALAGPGPTLMRRAPAARVVPPTAERDPWSLLAPEPAAALATLAPQGPGPRFKPHPSLGSTHVLLGQQQLDEDYWRPASRHLNFGLETSFERFGDWFGGEGGFFFTMDDDEGTYVDPIQGNTDIETDMVLVELYGGLHRTFFRESVVRPYVGAGVSVFWVEADQVIKPTQGDRSSDKEDEFAFGLYAHGGVSFQLGERFQIGLDVRAVGLTDVDVLTGPSGDLDYQQVSIFLGYGG